MISTLRVISFAVLAGVAHSSLGAQEGSEPVGALPATQAINATGLDLLRSGTTTGANALLSPYSIQVALAMTFAGAAGETRAEMAKVLHYPDNEEALHQGMAGLQKELAEIATR